MSFIRHRRATSPNQFECRNYDSKTQHFDTSAVEAVIKLVIGRGGDTTVVLDVMNNMDRSRIHFDFITHKGAKEEVVKKLRDTGSNVYVMEGDVRELGLAKYYKSILERGSTELILLSSSHSVILKSNLLQK